MRFLHTADWQIGMKADFVGAAGKEVRAQRLAAGQRLVESANAEKADFMLVAGDLFENNAVDRILVQKTVDILTGFNGLVYIIPGNHDPFVPGSVWGYFAWQSAQNLFVLHEEKPVELSNGLLFPCPVIDKYAQKDPTAWILPETTGGIRLGMAHGNVEGASYEDSTYLIPRDAAKKNLLDYLALGHWHSFATYPDNQDNAVRMAYSGTHETSRFGERDSGNALVIDISDPKAAPMIRTVKTGGLQWEKIETEIRKPGEIGQLKAELAALPDPETRLIDLKIKGILYAGESQELAHIESLTASRFLYSRMDTAGLFPAPDDHQWVEALPPGILQHAAKRLQDTAQSRGPEAVTAAQALLELFTISVEAGR